MYHKTDNPYLFKFITSAITGEGLTTVYLPPIPSEDKILFKKEQKWTRPVMPEHLRKEARRLRLLSDPESKNYTPDYQSPLAGEIAKWEDQEWERAENGVWIWVNNKLIYLTGFHYWFLSSWECYFGFPDFRITDVEITYALQYCEEDPNCFGMLLNTIRRYGKSSLMGGWLTYRTTRNRKHYAGAQGEKDSKIADFYHQMVLQPFKRLPYYFKPKYNEGTKQTRGISFERTTRRGKKTIEQIIEEEDDDSVLESYLDYRPSGEAEYDGSILHTYICEEPGKTLACSIHERWKIVKPCLRKGKQIRGKCFMGTTVEFMDVTDKGGRAYQKLFYDSDFNDKKADGRTKSGMYAFFIPGDTGYEGFFDEFGFPLRDEARKEIMLERDSVKDSPKDFSDLVRKYPLTIGEIFWVSSEKCVFNVQRLQRRKFQLDSSTVPMFSRYDLKWQNGVRFSKVVFDHNASNGWYKASWMFPGQAWDQMANKVKQNSNGTYSPLNEDKFTAGYDPVDHRVVIPDRMASSEEEFSSSRRSKPVLRVKRRYDSSIDGVMTQELLEKHRDEEYQYKTGISIGYMDVRTEDPLILYERTLMVAWLHGMSINVESAKPGFINYCAEHKCHDFVKSKYIPESDNKIVRQSELGTPANTQTIAEYTEALMFFIEYFVHCEPFVVFIDDYLIFNPGKTKEHDYAVASGWCELGEKIRPKNTPLPVLNIEDVMPTFRNNQYVPHHN